MIVSDEGIILKTFDLRETSKIVIFFTKDHGRVKGVLKGIRKDPKKFGSSIEKFSVNDFVYYEYTRSEFNLVSHCDLKQFFFNIRQDYKRNMAANYILDLVDTIMPLEQSNKRVYKLMLDYLNSLETIQDIDKLVHVFQIKILLLSGFRPHIDSCVKCNKLIHGRARFSMMSGGLICSNCPTQETSFHVISKGAIASILHIEKGEWSECVRLGLTASVRKELKYILNNFLIYHLEKRIRSSKFLN